MFAFSFPILYPPFSIKTSILSLTKLDNLSVSATLSLVPRSIFLSIQYGYKELAIYNCKIVILQSPTKHPFDYRSKRSSSQLEILSKFAAYGYFVLCCSYHNVIFWCSYCLYLFNGL